MKGIACFVFAMAVVASVPALALDVVVLKSGGELRGELTEATAEALHLDLLPGSVTIPFKKVAAIKQEQNADWYVQRAEGRPPAQRVLILGSAIRSGCADKAVQKKFAESCSRAAENMLEQKLFDRARRICRRGLKAAEDERLNELLHKADAGAQRAAAEIKALKLELKRRPDNDYARFLLGERYRSLGRKKKAFDQYRTVVAGTGAFDGGIAKMEELRAFIAKNLQIEDAPAVDNEPSPPPGELQEVEAAGFVIRCYSENLARRLASELPGIRKQVAQNLGIKTGKGCTVRVLPSRQAFVKKTGNRYGDGYTASGCIWTWHGAGAIVENIVPHEMAHVIIRRAAGKLPRWLDEGLAVRQEASAGAYWQVLRQDEPLPVNELLNNRFQPKSKSDNDRFYASAYALVDMLIQRGGMKGIWQLVDKLEGRSPEEALRAVYGIRSLRELEKLWQTHLNH
jgi:hypothetical protein